MVFAVAGGGQLDTGAYTIDNSIRFNDGDSPDLSRTNVASPTNSKKYTYSVWIKRGVFSDGENRQILSAINGNNRTQILFRSGNNEAIRVLSTDDAFSTFKYLITTNALYRDASAWYHVICVFDSTNATANDRFKIYVNGVEQSLSISTSVASNYDDPINSGSVAQDLGSANGSEFFDGYFAEAHFIDGQALSPTDFGEFDTDSGIWKPIQYTGSYGTNGFYLDFENSGSLGADQSGNGNNFTPTNLGATDQTTDTPTNNFATLNSTLGSGLTLSEGNTLVTVSPTMPRAAASTFSLNTGKWYCEVKLPSTVYSGATLIGVEADDFSQNTTVYSNNDGAYYVADGTKYVDGSQTSYGASFTTNDIIGIALNLDDDEITFYKNGASQGTITTKTFVGGYYFIGTHGSGSNSSQFNFNFGNPSFSISSGNSDGNGYGNFEYAPPTGFLALCTQNLATELSLTIDDGSQYFNILTWTGNGSNPRSFTGLGFQPDFTWQKVRSSASSHMLYDSTRGVGKRLHSDQTVDEATETAEGTITSFDSDGFTLDAGTSSDFYTNDSGATYVAWNWKANGGSTSSNTDGSITSTVQANTTAGFSIVTYTGTGSNATVGHGLGVTPDCFVVKRTSAAEGWTLYHHKNTSAPETDHLLLNSDAATFDQADIWNDTAPTSSVFSVGINTATNGSGSTYVVYCFAEIEGYSKFGRYTGNGSSNGPFSYTGFRPAFVMIKRTDTFGNWHIQDTTRNTYNVCNLTLLPNTTAAEESTASYDIDSISNGFKVKATNGYTNANGGTYVYMAFAENPFVSSGAVPVTAR